MQEANEGGADGMMEKDSEAYAVGEERVCIF